MPTKNVFIFFHMNLFTKIDIPESDCQIDYKSHLAFFGSCFADNISAQFALRKFMVLANPFGTVYNPLSLAKQIKAIADGKVFSEEDVFQDMRLAIHANSENDANKKNCVSNENGSDDNSSKENFGDSSKGNNAAPWHCWDAHSSLSASTREECIAKLNAAATQAREFLQKADVVFVTLGTSFVYFLQSLRDTNDDGNGNCTSAASETEYGTVVSNCHRQDPRLFERRMISVDEAAAAIREIVESLCKIKRDGILRLQASPSAQDDKQGESRENSQTQENCESRGLHIVFTVSPLRHMSDGAHGNTLSKATLQIAIDKVIHEIAASLSAPRNDVRVKSSRNAGNSIAEANQSCTLRNDVVTYFPSYEIVMDELRDYRFYDSDMVHLSKTAEEYIFERMTETYCDGKTRDNIKQVEKFLKMANHRIQDASSPATAKFLQKLHAEATMLESQINGLQLNV